MRAMTRLRIAGALGLSLASIPVLQMASDRLGASSLSPESRPRLARPRGSPTDRMLREARGWQLRAWEIVGEEREALVDWDPHITTRLDLVDWRRHQLALDRGGYLCRAREVARRAGVLSRSQDEAYRVALLLALIECDTGHYAAELKQARKLMLMAPRKATSLVVLRRAARCNGREELARQADAAMRALSKPLVVCHPPSSFRGAGPQTDPGDLSLADPVPGLRWEPWE
jgi:hypothetical protein